MQYNWPKELEFLQALGIVMLVGIGFVVWFLLHINVLFLQPSRRLIWITCTIDAVLLLIVVFGAGFIK